MARSNKRFLCQVTEMDCFIAQRTIVESHQYLEHVRFTTERIIDGILDPMFEQIQDPTAFIFAVDIGAVEKFSEERDMYQIDARLFEKESGDGLIDLRF